MHTIWAVAFNGPICFTARQTFSIVVSLVKPRVILIRNIFRQWNRLLYVTIWILLETFLQFLRKDLQNKTLVFRPNYMFVDDFSKMIVSFPNSGCHLKNFNIPISHSYPILMEMLCSYQHIPMLLSL